MMMIPWDQLHGAMTQFPIALLPFSMACEFGALGFKRRPWARELRTAGFYGLMLAAVASLGAAASGIALSSGLVAVAACCAEALLARAG